MLCATCKLFAYSVINQDFSAWIYIDHHGYSASLECAHRDYHAIEASRLLGCEFCVFFESQFEQLEDEHRARPSKVRCSINKNGRDQFLFMFDFVSDRHNEGDFSRFCPFQLFAVQDAEAYFLATSTNVQQLPCQVSTMSDSLRCIALAKYWLGQCENAHANCTRADNATLPTRVIDVGSTNGNQHPRLLHTHAKKGRYITLSYCWGTAGHVVTTTQNLEQHSQAITMDSLPRTIKDAISITRLLGFRYLWIDALCIVQDDRGDWEREAANMCSIYESAILSLAVLDARSSDDGFLHPRDTDNIIATLDGVKVGIRKPPSEARRRILGAQLETRAWTLQERVLAPAVLYFGDDQIYWECSHGLASETLPLVREEPEAANDSYYGRSVHDVKRLLRNQIQARDIKIWYELVEEYTGRLLTHEDDRLLAMQGLTTRFNRCVTSVHTFGLWSNELHTGLLWQLSGNVKANAVRNALAPSWSWASFEAPVVFSQKSGTGWIYPFVQRSKIEPSTVGRKGPPGSPSEPTPCLRIDGLRQVGFAHRVSKAGRRCDFLNMTSHSMLDRIQCGIDTVSDDVQKGRLIPTAYFCFLVAQRKSTEENTEYHFLILEEVPETHLYDTDLRVFRRAGVGRQEVFDLHGNGTGILADPEGGPFILV